MMTAPVLRLSRPALAGAVVLLLAGACGDDVQGPNDDANDDDPAAELLSTLIVSNPVTSDATAGAGLALSGFPFSEETVFVSLPPGSVSNGETAVIQTRGAEAQATAAMVDGGFDPIPLAAGAGDTLDIRIELAGGGAPLAFYAVVPPSIPPVIVRTDPPPKKRDVPLNAVMLVVFSEPIDAATVTTSSVQLLLDGVPVAGTLEFEDDANLILTLTTAEPLVPGADYTLLITQEIGDLDGGALEASHTSAFTTVAQSGAPGSAGEGSLWVMVFGDSGACIAGAKVEVVDGQRLGQSIQQTEPCSVWWPFYGGVLFEGLTPGVEMTIRASAWGYVAQEKTVLPGFGDAAQAVQIFLDRHSYW